MLVHHYNHSLSNLFDKILQIKH